MENFTLTDVDDETEPVIELLAAYLMAVYVFIDL